MFAAVVFIICLAVTAPLAASGLVVDQTARATGVAGAYVAQVDDATAVFFNPGALGLLTKKKGASAGAATSSFRPFHFQGRAPGPGAGTVGAQSTAVDIAPSLFATLPGPGPLVLGAGGYSAFRTRAQWETPEAFSGRFLATATSIDAYDVTTAAGLPLTSAIGIGGSLIYRTAKISLDRRLASVVGGTTRDIAEEKIATDMQSTLGWSAGLLVRPSPRFALGITYRAPIRLDLQGVGTLTQLATGDAQLDELVRASLPFDQNLAIATQLDTPAQLSAGIAFTLGEPLLLEFDVNRTQWKSLQSIAFVFPNNRTLDTSYALNLEETMDYRAGLRFQFPTGPIVRLGYAIENSPQPDETLSPFLAMLGRNTITAGFGLDWLDVAVGWSTFGKRSVTTSVQGFNGDYSGNEWTLVMTATK